VQHTVERPPPGEGIPVHYTFDEGQGVSAANSGTDVEIGAATLGGTTSWGTGGPRGGVVSLPGGGGSSPNFVRLPNNLSANMEDEITVSLWARPNALPNWVPLFQIGNGTDTFLLLQSKTQAAGATGFAATLKAPGNPLQERLTLGSANDLVIGEWTHIVFTMSGSTGKLYFDGELMGTRTDFTLGIDDVGLNGNTSSNYIGNNDYPDSLFAGLIDDVRVYEHALSDADVLALFEGDGGDLATTATTAPAAPDGADGWYVTAPTVTLTATGGTGTVTTEYAFGSGEWTAYTAPIAVPDGEHTLRYRSTDSSGTEEEKTLQLKVDATAPAAVLEGVEDGASYGLHELLSVTASGSDAGSGLASFELLLDGDPVESPLTLDLAGLLAGEHSLSAVAVDAAGNETAQSATFTVVVSFDTVGSLVERYRADGLVTNSQRQRMLAHLQAAESAADRGQVRQADQAVQRFASEALGVIDATARSRLLTAAETLREQLSP
jgi:hypothetical protein